MINYLFTDCIILHSFCLGWKSGFAVYASLLHLCCTRCRALWEIGSVLHFLTTLTLDSPCPRVTVSAHHRMPFLIFGLKMVGIDPKGNFTHKSRALPKLLYLIFGGWRRS